jgi:hypothetical protein
MESLLSILATITIILPMRQHTKETILTTRQCFENIDKLIALTDTKFGWAFEYEIGLKRVYHRGMAHCWSDEHDKPLIVVCTSQSVERMYYVFLHEIGHLLGRVEDSANWCKKYPELLRTSGVKTSSKLYKIARVQDEIEAWNLGFEFAKKHRLEINLKKWNRLRSECLTGYMKMVTVKQRRKNKSAKKQ